jgi:hypothetical protein
MTVLRVSVLELHILAAVGRIMPSDFERVSSEGDGDQPPSEENGGGTRRFLRSICS